MKTTILSMHATLLLLTLTFFSNSCSWHDKAPLPHAATGPTSPSEGPPPPIRTPESSACVACGLQDKVGNLWFGTTAKGVYRYDGKQFRLFTTNDGVSSNCVWSMLEDTSGNIWFGTADGICRYDGNAFSSIAIGVTDTGTAMPSSVWSILQDRRGTLWFGRSDAVYCYDGTVFTRFLQDNSVINNSGLRLGMVEAMLEDGSGNIWFGSGTGEGICRFDGKAIVSFRPDGAGGARCIAKDRHGDLWFASRQPNTVRRYDGHAFSRFGEKDGLGIVTCILEDRAGRMWFGADGLWCCNEHSLTELTTKNGLSHEGVWCIVEDRSGNIWVGTRYTGLCRYDGMSFTDVLGSGTDR